jgi:hypothetical protein
MKLVIHAFLVNIFKFSNLQIFKLPMNLAFFANQIIKNGITLIAEVSRRRESRLC